MFRYTLYSTTVYYTVYSILRIVVNNSNNMFKKLISIEKGKLNLYMMYLYIIEH